MDLNFDEDESYCTSTRPENFDNIVGFWFQSNVCGPYKSSNLKIAYHNVNSIQNKLDEVKNVLIPKLFAESKIDKTFSNDSFKQPGTAILEGIVKKGWVV